MELFWPIFIISILLTMAIATVYASGFRGIRLKKREKIKDYSRAARRARSIARIQKVIDKGLDKAERLDFDPDRGERTVR